MATSLPASQPLNPSAAFRRLARQSDALPSVPTMHQQVVTLSPVAPAAPAPLDAAAWRTRLLALESAEAPDPMGAYRMFRAQLAVQAG